MNVENLDSELWRDIRGYEGLYQVSSHGNVKSIDRIIRDKNGRVKISKGRLLAFTVEKDGYFQLHLSKGNVSKLFKVHKLVAEAFIQPIKGKNLVNHKNGLKQINHVKNLEWVNNKENTQHAHKLGLINYLVGEDHPKAILTNRKVLRIRELHSTGNYTQVSLAKLFNVSVSAVAGVLNGRNWNHI